ncbi:putative o-methyltransferase family protein [Eutypa lata UCREL1]|uniref:Putative o-methyltransferase family protein n=1 Tax=Eutypa lata (strain UCR-EL1) TaxID=1287681 RepID=M7SNC9_EUTLA|nr:putative o-methyltransferase family protein [Eutypa lata UCREL1]
MKETTPILYPNDIVGERVSYYAEAQTSRIPQHIIDYHAHVGETQPKTAIYMVSISQAQAMAFLARIVGAKRVLEVDVYVGLSSLVWSHAVGPDGKVTGLEFDAGFANQARVCYANHGVNNVEVI